jgi:hypothetical protein
VAHAAAAGRRRAAGAARVATAVLLLLAATACHDEVRTDELVAACQPAGGSSTDTCRPADGTSTSSQEEINSFAGCQHLEGALIVRHDVSDLSPLSSLKVIDGGVSGGGYRSKPFSLDALCNLEVIGGNLNFKADNVTSFRGLAKLHSVGGGLAVTGVPELEDFRGLEKVRSLSHLRISYNPKLRSFAGLDGLEEVKGDVYIDGTELVPAEEIDALLARITVGGTISRH